MTKCVFNSNTSQYVFHFHLMIPSTKHWLLYQLLFFRLQPADIYLIDEPSAHLDSEQRLLAAKVIKRFILHQKKTAFIVEHDFIMAAYLADKVLVFEGKPSVDCIASAPQSLASGMNRFLSVSSIYLFSSLPQATCSVCLRGWNDQVMNISDGLIANFNGNLCLCILTPVCPHSIWMSRLGRIQQPTGHGLTSWVLWRTLSRRLLDATITLSINVNKEH
jgi:hypothetical protein